MKEYLATLDDAAFGAASEVTPKFVSPSDPAAQWTGAMRGPAFYAYADNYLVDVCAMAATRHSDSIEVDQFFFTRRTPDTSRWYPKRKS